MDTNDAVAKIGILTGSLLAAVIGATILGTDKQAGTIADDGANHASRLQDGMAFKD